MSAFGENIRREIRSSRTAWTITFLLLVALLVQSKWDQCFYSNTLRACIINGNTAYIGYLDPIAKNNEAIKSAAKRAVKLIYGRVPDKIEEEEDLKRAVNTPVLNDIEKTWNENKPVYMARRITTDFHIDGDVKCLYIDSNSVDALVTGNVSQDELLEGQWRTTHKQMRVLLHFVVNEKWVEMGKWPLVVIGYQSTPI